MATVSKAGLAHELVAEYGFSKTLAKQFVGAFFTSLGEAIIEGDRIEARGFGIFDVKKTNAKPSARNPKTGERVYVPARRKVKFKPGRLLKASLSKPLEQVGTEIAGGKDVEAGL